MTRARYERQVVAALVVLGIGCGPTVDLNDGSASGSGDATGDGTTVADTSSGETTSPTTNGPTTTTSSTTADDPTTGSGSGDTTGAPVECPAVDGFDCSAPLDCELLSCGDANSQFDEDGCMRAACDGVEDCADGELCHAPSDWGGCAGSGLSCQDDPELGCSCISKPDCGGRFCVPQELVPPTDCSALTTETECLDAGCGPFVTGRSITDAGGGACLCDLPTDLCVYVPPGAEVSPGPALYLDPNASTVIKLPQVYDPPPFGWVPCEDQLGSSLCQCAAALPCEL